jgi:hypothetical protein
MATDTLTLPDVSNLVHRQFERMRMLQELADMAIDALPNTTDSDSPLALLNGMKEILSVDTHSMWRLFERLESQAAQTNMQTTT